MRPTPPEHLSLAPPPEPGQGRAMGLSLLAHAALALALAWGVRWNASNPQVAFTAEIWSPTAQEAAPAAFCNAARGGSTSRYPRPTLASSP